MALSDYKFFPNSGLDSLTWQDVVDTGVYIGDINLDATRYQEITYALKRSNPDFVKYAFYKKYSSTVPGVTFYDVVWCVQNATTETSLHLGEDEYQMPSGIHTYIDRDYGYSTNPTAPGIKYAATYQYFDINFLPASPPIYDTMEQALQAMDDGIWSQKDKYDGGGYSHTGGGADDTWGEGSLFDHSSDPIDFSALPDDIGVDTSMFRVYLPTSQQLSAFSDFLWSNAFDITQLKKLWADPMDYIIGLQALPFTISGTAGSRPAQIGNVSSGVSMAFTKKQFHEIDLGSLIIKPFWNAYLDAEPYTRMQIFLPFIGYRDISADECIGKTLHLKYQIDIVSGACMAQLKIGDALRYSFAGQCSATIPLQSRDWIGALQAYVGMAGQAASIALGNVTPQNVTGMVQSAMGVNKPTIQRSGSFAGSGGFMGCKEPHVVITRPIQALPEKQDELEGYPSFIYAILGSCKGFTAIDSWKPEGFTCTAAELDEITDLLTEGVYL